MGLFRTTSAPLYAQVRDVLRAEITDGTHAPGDKLPSESILAARFGVNRLTLRHAVAELAREGLVIARQGSGTYVTASPPPYSVEMAASSWSVEAERATQPVTDSGHTVAERILTVRREDTQAFVREHLSEESVLYIESIALTDNEPTIRNQFWVVSSWSPEDVLEEHAESFGIAAVQNIAGNELFYSWRSFDAVAATPRDAEILDVDIGTPLLRRTGVNTNAEGTPLVFLRRDAPGSRMRIILRGPQPKNATE